MSHTLKTDVMKIIYLILMPLVIALSCKTTKETKIVVQDFEVLLQEAYGGLEDEEQRIVRNEKELQDVYGIINRFRRPGIPAPEIDFKKYIVVALFMGEKTTGGFSTQVGSVSIDDDDMIVNVIEKGPKPTDFVTTAICQPFCLVKILKPKSDKKVIFVKTQ